MRNTLKVISIIMIVFAIIDLLWVIIPLLGSGCAIAAGEIGAGVVLIIATVIVCAGGLFQLFSGICGLKGSNGDYNKLKTAIVLGWISVIANVLGNISTIISDFTFSNFMSFLFGLVIPVIFLVSAKKTKAQMDGQYYR